MDIRELIENKFRGEYISSRSNPYVTMLAKLDGKKHRDEYGLFLAEGVKLAGEALDYADCDALVVSESGADGSAAGELCSKALSRSVRLVAMSGSAFSKISTERSPQGVIAVVKIPEETVLRTVLDQAEAGKRSGPVIYLDSVQDPGNLGTILRSAEAFGALCVVADGCADTWNGRTVRASMGAVFRIPVVRQNCREALAVMRDKGYDIAGMTLSDRSLELGKFRISRKTCFVIGNEGHGISEDIVKECTYLAKIPMAGKAESLNAAQACTLVLWEASKEGI